MKKRKPKQYFFKHEQMDFEVQFMLGRAYYSGCDVGEVFSTVERIRSGDFESWYTEWSATAERVRGLAEKSDSEGHTVSAREAYLRAANCYAMANVMVDGTDDPSRVVPTWRKHIDCWEAFCRRLAPPADIVQVPFKPNDGEGPWPTIIFNNGSDGPTAGTWSDGIAAALQRGYAAFTFDGPGQNALLWLHNIPFRHDWEKVITPVVDYLLDHHPVDPERLVLSGISQGGYWILRALAFEHRIAAGIADPGLMNVSTAISDHFPKRLMDDFKAGNEEKFNHDMEFGLHFAGKAARQTLSWRMKPYGTDNYYQWLKKAAQFDVSGVIKQIKCPMFIADPEDEQFWPGQPQQVYDALECPKKLVRFTAAEGANRHCEPKARSLYNQRVFDWLDGVLKPA
jgi:hypothetical protein